jgi:hypothetical protein
VTTAAPPTTRYVKEKRGANECEVESFVQSSSFKEKRDSE